MKNNTYKSAVEHLLFTDDLHERVLEKTAPVHRAHRVGRTLALAAVICTLMVTTAIAVSSYVQSQLGKMELPIPVQTLATVDDTFENAKVMEFTSSTDMEGITTHYMELDNSDVLVQYMFCNGYLYDFRNNYYRITEDYRLEAVAFLKPQMSIEKAGTEYSLYSDYRYLDTPDGVISIYHKPAQKNAAGEILVNVYHDHHVWPAYLHVQSGQIRDALPQLMPHDFCGRITGSYELSGGMMISTLINEDNEPLAVYYWIGKESNEAVVIEMPECKYVTVDNGMLFYRDQLDAWYCMDEKLQFHRVADHHQEGLESGLLMKLITNDGKLGVYDGETDRSYVFVDISISATHNDNLDNYHFSRYGDVGIMLIKMEKAYHPQRMVLSSIGVMDMKSCQLKLLKVENGYEILKCSWLDANRLAVIYAHEQRQYLCIYEFE